ncbi:MAG: peptidase domain-containing ABC transporter [Bacteroidales bacterium]
MKPVHKIRQHDKSDCAVACICSIAQWYGLRLPLITIREACGASKSGTTIKGVIDGCNRIGFSAKAFKSTESKIDPLYNIGKPCILHFLTEEGDLHFVVLNKIEKGVASIMDPADGGYHKMTIEQLQKRWSGYLIIMTPDINFESGNKTESVARRFFSLVRLTKKYFLLSFSGSLIYIIAGISTSLFLQYLIDKVLPNHDFAALSQVGIIMVMLMIATLFIGYCRILFTLRAGISIDNLLILKYLNHLFKLPLSFFSLRGAGELNSRIGDAMKIRSFLTEGLIGIIVSVVTLIVSFALMFTFYWKLALLTLIFIPSYLILYYFSNKINKRVNRDIIEKAASFEEKTVEGITAVRAIKYFGIENIFARRIESQYISLARKIYDEGRYLGIFATYSDAISKVLTVTLLITGSIFIFKGELSVGELVSFYSLTAFFSSPLSQLVNINNEITEANISAERLFDIIDLEPEIDSSLEFPLNKCYDIVFDNVTFSYPGCNTLLNNYSMVIDSGKITAITGESGCGKSSIAALIMRGYRVQKGNISIRGVDINLINLKSWRNYVSIVPQDPDLINGTILENITCGNSDPDLEKVISIIEKLGLSDFISSMPMGLLTKIGEHGCCLSGGQKQRIALSRALYKEPFVLILDEATSSLDNESQKYILDTIIALRDKGNSIIMITHKSDNIMIADKIIDMSAHSKVDIYTPQTVV